MTTSLAMGLPGVEFAPGDHICAFYRGPLQRDELLLPYLREGLRAGDKCICVTDDPAAGESVRALTAGAGQLQAMDSGHTYLAGGYFAIDRMLDFWDAAIGAAVLREGFGFVRAVGEMTWALRDLPGVELLLAYEARLNGFLHRYPQVLLADCEADWESLRASVMRELGGGRARLGVGECCEQVGEFPRSYQQAKLALRLPAQAEWDDRAIRFDDLGVYRLLVGIEDLSEVERFVQRWLGKLLEYDAQRGSDLVRTLTHHLERGGNYELTAKSLIVHRNTLKYRLQRIRQIGGLDLNDPETWFNLHLATRAWSTLGVLRAHE